MDTSVKSTNERSTVRKVSLKASEKVQLDINNLVTLIEKEECADLSKKLLIIFVIKRYSAANHSNYRATKKNSSSSHISRKTFTAWPLNHLVTSVGGTQDIKKNGFERVASVELEDMIISTARKKFLYEELEEKGKEVKVDCDINGIESADFGDIEKILSDASLTYFRYILKGVSDVRSLFRANACQGTKIRIEPLRGDDIFGIFQSRILHDNEKLKGCFDRARNRYGDLLKVQHVD